MITRLAGIGLAFLLMLPAMPAKAAWHEASSDHFVIYGDTRADDLERFGEMLERFHKAMELETGREVPVPSPSSRVTVYMVGSDRELRELYGDRDSNVAGFYMSRASGSVAFVPNIKIGSGEPDFSLAVLLHEYAHHFLISTSRHAMPRWLSEGAAEYFASARFPRDGSIEIGLPNNHRAAELQYADDVSVRELVDYELYRQRDRGNRYDAFYGRSWLLFHYLAFNKERAGQRERYWQGVAGGRDSLEVAEEVFGDLDQLEKELKSYGRTRRMPAFKWNVEALPIGRVAVRELSDGMAAMMPVILESRAGVDRAEAAALVPAAREVAARFPKDAGVLAALAEAEYDAGNDAEAIAAADRAIAADPETKNAYVQKGYALFRQALEADDGAAAYTAAVKPFTALNRLENDHPLPLIYFYRSFAARGEAPPEQARHALERAAQLAPFDQALGMEVAVMLAAEGQPQLASYFLAPLAANPHGGKLASVAAELMTTLATAPEGQPFRVTLSTQKDAGSEEEEVHAPAG